MNQSRLKGLFDGLRRTPLHPQWFAFLREDRNLRKDCAELTGLVLDIGCADQKPRRFLRADAEYVGLDYFDTATGWYGTRPDIFGDAQRLPLQSGSVDHVLLLDVLEHLPRPGDCLGDIHRVLRPGGKLTIQVPFMYPLHDAPLDFHRWTRYGLHRAAREAGFEVSRERAIGHPLETAALAVNIASSKSVINWIRDRKLLAVLAVTLPFLVLCCNVTAWVLARLSNGDDLMPYAYRMVWTKV